MFQLVPPNSSEVQLEQLRNARRRVNQIMECNLIDLYERVDSKNPPANTVECNDTNYEELYKSVQVEYTQRQLEVTQLGEIIKRSLDQLNQQFSSTNELKSWCKAELAQYYWLVRNTETRVIRSEEALHQAHDDTSQKEIELTTAFEEVIRTQKRYKQAVSLSFIRELQQEEGNCQKSIIPHRSEQDQFQQRRLKIENQIQEMKRSLALKQDNIQLYEREQQELQEEIREQIHRNEKGKNHLLVVQENLKDILHKNKEVRQQIEYLAEKLRWQTKRYHSLKEEDSQPMMDYLDLKRCYYGERSFTFDKCMSILSNRSYYCDEELESNLQLKKSSLLELPTFDTDPSMLHISIVSINSELDSSIITQTNQHQKITFEHIAFNSPETKEYCMCQKNEPGLFRRLLCAISTKFADLSERMVTKRIKNYYKINKGYTW